jgi:hypothetical protein
MLLVTLAVVFVLSLAAAGLIVQRARQSAELDAVAAAADAAETRLAAESALVAARNAEATAVARLATAEAQGGGQDEGSIAVAELATARAMADEASVVQATAQAAQLTAVAARQAAQTTATSTPLPSPTATNTPEPTPVLPSPALVREPAAIFVAPASDSATLGFVAVGEQVQVIGQAENDGWLYVRSAGATEGFVWGDYLTWEGDVAALPVVYPTVTPQVATSPTPAQAFVAEYRGCRPHSSGLGSVKGQVLNASGDAIEGALVEIWINGAPWDSSSNPARTNRDGWYEWVLSVDQTIRFVRLAVDGRDVTFSPTDLEVVTESGCFQQVDFLEQ